MVGRKPKLTPLDLIDARSRFKSGETKRALAQRFNVADKTMAHYLRGDHKSRELVAVSAYPL